MAEKPKFVAQQSDAVFTAALWDMTRGTLLFAWTQPPELEPALAAHGCVLVPITSREDLRVALWRTPRFGMPEWEGASATVLAALAGRALRGDDWDSFPGQALPPLVRPVELRRRLAETETALTTERNAHAASRVELTEGREAMTRAEYIGAEAELLRRTLAETETALATERNTHAASRVELTETREAVTRAERIRAAAELLLADAQEQALRSEDRQRAAEARAAVAEAHAARAAVAEARAAVAEERAAAIEASTIWRSSGAIRTRLVARPGLRRALRAVLRPVWHTGRMVFGRKRFTR